MSLGRSGPPEPERQQLDLKPARPTHIRPIAKSLAERADELESLALAEWDPTDLKKEFDALTERGRELVKVKRVTRDPDDLKRVTDELAKVTRKTATANPMQTHGKKLLPHLKMRNYNLS